MRGILAAVLIVLALLAGTLIVGSHGFVPPPVSTREALPPPVATDLPASPEPTPTLPPLIRPAANGLIAYVWRGDLYVGDPVSGATTAIATGPGKIGGPQFSPDGTHIAFYRSDTTRQSGIGPEIVVVRADGSEERVVVPRDRSGTGHFAWTPDSASLVVANDIDERPSSAPTPPYDQSLAIIDVSGVTEPRLLTPPLPRWPGRQWMVPTAALAQMFRPPVGDRIAAGDWESLEVFDDELSTVAQLGPAAIKGPEPYWVRWPTWSPDGSMILFSLDRGEFGWFDSVVGSFVVDADGGEVRRVGPPSLSAMTAWSPDGSTIAMQVWSEPEETVIVIVDVASGAERELASTAVNPTGAGPIPQGWTWSPDGRSILFVKCSGARPIVVDVASGQSTELPWKAESAPSWQRIPLD
jgi:dipeptidyl aminopeptidase/acylaminoacyl peptidase